MPAELVATHSYLPWSDSSLLSICKAPVGTQRRRSGLDPEEGSRQHPRLGLTRCGRHQGHTWHRCCFREALPDKPRGLLDGTKGQAPDINPAPLVV